MSAATESASEAASPTGPPGSEEPIYETVAREEVAIREKRDRRQSFRKSRNRMTMVIDPEHDREASSMLLEQVAPSVATLVTPRAVEVRPTPPLPPLKRAQRSTTGSESDDEKEREPVVEIYEMDGGSAHNCTLKEHNGFTRFVWRILSCLHDTGHIFTSSPCCVKTRKKKRFRETDVEVLKDDNDK